MLETLKQRKEYVEKFKNDLKNEFPHIDYQVWIFGSFLTEEYNQYSDMDVSIYCDNVEALFDITDFINDYLSRDNIEHDIIIFEFNKNHYINIPIICYGTALTEYEPPHWLEYIKEMISIWGMNPMNKLLERSKV